MTRSKNRDSGAALAMVIVFVMVLSVLIGSVLLITSAGASEVAKAQSTNSEQAAALEATMLAATDAINAPVTGTGTDNSCASVAGSYSAQGLNIVVDCEAFKDSSLVQALDGLMLMGANSSTTANANTSSPPTAGVDYGVNLQLPSVNCTTATNCIPLVIGNGNVRSLSNSSSWNFTSASGSGTGSNTYMRVGGVLRVPDATYCGSSQVLTSQGTGTSVVAACAADPATDPRSSSAAGTVGGQYWKTLLDAVKKADISGAQIQVVPDLPAPWGNTCTSAFNATKGYGQTTNSWGQNVFRLALTPGLYDGTALMQLNGWTSQSSWACGAGEPLEVFLPAGSYVFAPDINTQNAGGTCRSSAVWCISTPYMFVASAAFRGFDATTSCVPQESGVQVVLQQTARILVKGAQLGLCPPTATGGAPALSVVALDSTTAGTLGLDNSSAASRDQWDWTRDAAKLFPTPFSPTVKRVTATSVDRSTTRPNKAQYDNTYVFTVDTSTVINAIEVGTRATFDNGKTGAQQVKFTGNCITSTGRKNNCTSYTSTDAQVTSGLDARSSVGDTFTVFVTEDHAPPALWPLTITFANNPQLITVYGFVDSFAQGFCANYSIPGSNLYAQLSALCVDPTGLPNTSSVAAVVNGSIFMPGASVAVNVSNGSSWVPSYFNSGIISSAFTLRAAGSAPSLSSKQPINVKAPPKTNGDRLLRFRAHLPGGSTVTSVMQVRDHFGQTTKKGDSIILNQTTCDGKAVGCT